MQPSETSTRDRSGGMADLVDLIHIGSMSQAVCVAAELRIADLLGGGCGDVDELAQATDTHGPSLHRLLRALTSLKLCIEREDGSFALSPKGLALRTDAPDSLRSWILWCGKYQWPVWGNLLYSVKTGKSARKLATGTDGFGHLERDPQAAAVFNDAMVELTRVVAGEVVRAYDFAGRQQIVDVGDGHGALLAVVLERQPGARGMIFDLPHAIAGAKAYLAKQGLANRCDFIAGDFFTAVPSGADAYLLKNIIHDWDDEHSALILRNCRRAMSQEGKLLLVERIMPERLEASSSHRAVAWADLTMLLGSGGCQRTEAEFRCLLDSTGFVLTRVIPTSLEYSVLEVVPG
jgi:hypothetical protein